MSRNEQRINAKNSYQSFIKQPSGFDGNSSGQDNKPYCTSGTEHALGQK